MWYTPYLRVRRAVFIYVSIGIALALIAIVLRFWPGAVQAHHAGRLRFHIELAMILPFAGALVGGFATVLGLNLAAENDGHLELAWTKPVSREGYALGVFAVDIAAMAACIVLTAIGAVLVVDVYAGGQVVSLGAWRDVLSGLLFCGFPLCVYAWVTALSASLKRNRGAIAGIIWPVFTLLSALRAVPNAAVHAVTSALGLVNPIVLFTKINSAGPPPTDWMLGWGWAVAGLLLTAAILQWRRLQL